jgi:arylsulfatase A-like enzyme
VVFFFTDQQRWDTTGIHGNPLDLTPNFDRVAQQGTHCYNTFTCQPVCAPARASLQTGLYATNTSVWRNGMAIPADQKTLGHYFREAGYTTGYIGKWHLGDGNLAGEVLPERRSGYDYWLGSNLLEFTSDAYRTVMYDENMHPVRLPGYRVDAITDSAIRYIDAHQQQPFFLFLSYLEPHFQNSRDDYPAPDGYEEKYTGRWTPPDLAALPGTAHRHLPGYYGMVKRLDESYGRILDALKSLDLLENTIVVFTSDHGNHFKTRNGEYKRSCHESSIRIPLSFTGPGFNGGGRIQKLVSLLDVPPTLLDACGIPIPAAMQGRSILSLVNHTEKDWSQEVFLQISESQVGRCVRTARWKYSVSAPGVHGWSGPGADVYREEFLYDLFADPYEFNNLIDHEGYEQVKQVMRERLVRRMVEAGEPAPQIEEVPNKTPRGQRVLQPGDPYL